MQIQTERLLLRPLEERDFDAYLPLHSDPEVMRFVGGRHDPDAVRIRFDKLKGQWAEHRLGHWATYERESGRLVGAVGLLRHDDWTATDCRVEVGWLIGKRDWDRGYATEAGRASIDYAFVDLGLERLICIVDPRNVASRRVAEKLGLRLAGETIWRDYDVVWYETRQHS
ncbi:MAG TPA: GNAT family N-acetyltransferase [Actinomycetota bacterium]|nr:GNAT family N-acetyltransferase [Actinomycetota bacterium]